MQGTSRSHRSLPVITVCFLLSVLLVTALTPGVVPVQGAERVHAAVPGEPGNSGGALESASVRALSGSLQIPGGTVALPVEAVGVQNLGAATVMIGYDPAVLKVIGCQRNAAFDAGLCNSQFDRDDDGVPDAVRFNVISLGGLNGSEGSPLNFVNITWGGAETLDTGATSVLEVEIRTFTDTDGIPIEASAENGRVTVTIVPTATPTPTVVPTPTPALSTIEGYAWKDRNCDGLREEGEPGFPQMKILLDVSSLQESGMSVALAVTDVDGYYRFEDITPGTHGVQTTAPEGWWPTTDTLVKAITTPRQTLEVSFGFCQPFPVSYLPLTLAGRK